MRFKALYFNNKSLNLNVELIKATALIVLAIITGTMAVYLSEAGSEIKIIFLDFISESLGNSYIRTLPLQITVNLSYVFICFVSGTSIYGRFLIYLLCYYKMVGIASIASTLIKSYLLKGLEYCLLIFIPGKLLLVFGIILITVNSLKVSKALCDLHKEGIALATYDKSIYLKQIAFSCLIILLSSIIDTILPEIFLPLFEFA